MAVSEKLEHEYFLQSFQEPTTDMAWFRESVNNRRARAGCELKISSDSRRQEVQEVGEVSQSVLTDHCRQVH